MRESANKKEDSLMKLQLYAIFDTASGIYDKMVFARADGEVTREFQDLVTKADHPYAQHPEDYTLFRLASYDNLTGKITDEANECLATGLELVALSRNIKSDNEEFDFKSPGGTE